MTGNAPVSERPEERRWQKRSPETTVCVFQNQPMRAEYTFPGIRRCIFWAALAVTVCAGITACTCRDNKEETPRPALPPAAAPSAEHHTSQELPPTPTNYMTATVRVVSLSGEPLPAMTPIATLQPNAFDKPIASGPLTNENGESQIRFASLQKVCLRAWDPKLNYFPNNFFEVLPGAGVVEQALTVTMVASATLEGMLFLPDGRPASNENAGIMLFHPTHGPWWPSEADTNERGEAKFLRIPPGKYVLRVKVASGPMLEIPETYIAPGETTALGMIYLK